jgi:predicted DNA binding CopG/RHH family protein
MKYHNWNNAKNELEEEEKELLSSFEKGEWKKVRDMNKEIDRHVEYAKATHRKDKRVNVRVSEKA